MGALVFSGKELAARVRQEVKEEVEALKAQGIQPYLAVILVGDDPASQVYVRNKERSAKKVGIESHTYRLPAETSQQELLALLQKLNADPKVHGILVQLPLPDHINERDIILSINPIKDVDGFHPENLGRLVAGYPRYLPCTPRGVMRILHEAGVNLKGQEAVVVGRSVIVGKPMGLMLLAEHATVTTVHSRTRDLAFHTRRADVLVVAAGRAGLIKGDMVKEGAVVIDVGVNRMPDGSLKGDVEFDEVVEKASVITPVPGGVGPMTVAMLMKNTVEAAKLQTLNREA